MIPMSTITDSITKQQYGQMHIQTVRMLADQYLHKADAALQCDGKDSEAYAAALTVCEELESILSLALDVQKEAYGYIL